MHHVDIGQAEDDNLCSCKYLGIQMRNEHFARLAVAATLAFGLCPLANADSFKVVNPPAHPPIGVKQTQSDIAQAVVPSPDEFNPAEMRPRKTAPVAETPSPGEPIAISAGGIAEVNSDWPVRRVYVGDEKLIEVIAVSDRTLLVRAKHADEKSGGGGIAGGAALGNETGKTAFYLVGDDNKSRAYEVVIDPLPHARAIEVHNSKVLANSIGYECHTKGGCSYPVVHEVKKEDLPRGYSSSAYSGLSTNSAGPAPGGAPQ